MKPILLTRHPNTPSIPMTLPVRFERDGQMFRISYRIPGDTTDILLPTESDSIFRDGLWEHTCFELFIKPDGGADYLELNFSPSTEWAAYSFDSYRAGMRRSSVMPAKIVSTPWKNRYELSVGVYLDDWQKIAWRVGISAVIEEKSGRKSYWALTHPKGPPDFHHDACFAATLPAIGRA